MKRACTRSSRRRSGGGFTNIESLVLFVSVVIVGVTTAVILRNAASDAVIGLESSPATVVNRGTLPREEPLRSDDEQRQGVSNASEDSSDQERSWAEWTWGLLGVVPGFAYGLTVQTLENFTMVAEQLLMLPELANLFRERLASDQQAIARGITEGDTHAVAGVIGAGLRDMSSIAFGSVVAIAETTRDGAQKFMDAVRRGEGFAAGETLGRGVSTFASLAGSAARRPRPFPPRVATRSFPRLPYSSQIRLRARWPEIFDSQARVRAWMPPDARDALLYFSRTPRLEATLDHVADALRNIRNKRQRATLHDEIAYAYGSDLKVSHDFGQAPLTWATLETPARGVSVPPYALKLADGTEPFRHYVRSVRMYQHWRDRWTAAYASYLDDPYSSEVRAAYRTTRKLMRESQESLSSAATQVRREGDEIYVAQVAAENLKLVQKTAVHRGHVEEVLAPPELATVQQRMTSYSSEGDAWVSSTPSAEVQRATHALGWVLDAEKGIREQALVEHLRRGFEVRFYLRPGEAADATYAAWFRNGAVHVIDADSVAPYPTGFEPMHAHPLVPLSDLLRTEGSIKAFRKLLIEELHLRQVD